MLLVVATPLGNLEDISPRALEALRTADLVACEDTRRTAKLLARHGIEVPTLSCHRFNETRRIESLLERVRSGARVALVSDGGTPGISDPGAQLVRAALEAGLPVRPLPGPSAPVALLSASGMPADRYVFDGFLPARAGERRRRLRELREERRTLLLFEAPHRIRAALSDIGEILGDREVVLGRELTKVHETILRGTAEEVRARLGTEIKGEITLAVSGCRGDAGATDARASEIVSTWRREIERAAGDRRAALRQAARALGLDRAELRRRLDELGEAG
jgi:16S rRNA (cytidine1402-2'-O)-methyltransferase